MTTFLSTKWPLVKKKFGVIKIRMKIYTKRGDAGETGLVGGVRVPKDDLRIRTYGALDELNAVLGVALSMGQFSGQHAGLPENLRKSLVRLQGELFQLGAELATPRGKSVGIALIDSSHVMALEKEIDEIETQLKPLKTFILPGGASYSAWIHLARTVSRRAERELVTLNRAEPLRPAVLQYLNRLSDYLFVVARFVNQNDKIEDIPWIAPSL